MTREHLIARNILRERPVNVTGYPWTSDGGRVSIGPNSFTAKVLCKAHNNALSPIDQRVGKAFWAIREFEEILSGRRQTYVSCDLRHDLSGMDLERWFLKTAVNTFIVAGVSMRWPREAERSLPPLRVVQAAFGQTRLRRPAGLYTAVGEVGDALLVGDQVYFRHIKDEHRHLSAVEFEFQAIRYLLWLREDREMPWSHLHEHYRHIGAQLHAGNLMAELAIHWDALCHV